MSERNLYAPPSSAVADVQPLIDAADGVFVPGGRSVSAGHGWTWYKMAWALFKRQPLTWWVSLVALLAAFIVLSLVPLLNILAALGFPVMIAGIGACADSCRRTGRFDIGQVFDGFRRRPGALLLAGLLTMLATVLIFGVLVAVAGGGFGVLSFYTGSLEERQAASEAMMAGAGLIGMLLYMVAMALIMSLAVFTPYLIHEQGVGVIDAMKQSMQASFRNFGAGLVAIVAYVVLAMGASIPLMLGWLVLLPVICLVGYAAYRDLFFQP